MSELFCEEATKVCKTCLEEKPVSEFYKCGNSYQARCRECQKKDRRITSLYKRFSDKAVKDWPVELLELAKEFTKYEAAGGHIEYMGSNAYATIQRYKAAAAVVNLQAGTDLGTDVSTYALVNADISDEQLESVAKAIQEAKNIDAFKELLMQLTLRVDELAKAFNDFKSAMPVCSPAMSGETSGFGWTDFTDEEAQRYRDAGMQRSGDAGIIGGSAAGTMVGSAAAPLNDIVMPDGTQDRQECLNLIYRIEHDSHLKNVFGDELQDLIRYFKDAIVHIRRFGYLDPYNLRNIALMFESYQEPLSFEAKKLYTKFLLPGIRAAQLRDDYQTLVDSVAELLEDNYYEVDWNRIPLSIE